MFEGFRAYYTNCAHENGSSLAKARYHAARKNNRPIEDIAKFELSGLFGMLINTVPCTFWIIFDIFSNPRLLQDIRKEISIAVVGSLDNGTKIKSFDMGTMKESCHLVSSVFQETLRTRSTGSSIRRVRQDFLLADRYLFKKDSMVQMPFSIIHENKDLWGKAAKDYNPRRFMKATSSSSEAKQAIIKPGTFRGFGGGTTLYPGRHFATAEITSVAAMLAMRFEISPVAAEGWKEPKQAKNHGATSFLPPEQDLKVKITRRRGLEHCEWRYNVQTLKTGFVAVNEIRE